MAERAQSTGRQRAEWRSTAVGNRHSNSGHRRRVRHPRTGQLEETSDEVLMRRDLGEGGVAAFGGEKECEMC